MALGRVPTTSHPDWWRTAVVYQVYIRSFRDGDGDGVGDIAGLRAGLRYIRDLGVDAIWINPWYRSPMVDAGYDVADYRDIDPAYGTLAAATELIAEAHSYGLRVLVDLVPNHTSDQHAWFQAARVATPGSPERARYVFREGRGTDGSQPPNDWRSCFGGPAWTRLPAADGTPGQWYLHLFAPAQPDLDWTCPEVPAEFLAILEFWLQRGVDGFRVDVAHALAKADGLPDVGYAALGLAPYEVAETQHVQDHPHWDRDEIHAIYRSWRRLSLRYPQVAFVAEAVVDSLDRVARYVRPDELHTTFNFPFMRAPWSARALYDVIDESITTFGAVGAAPTWALGNHDVVRVATRYGEGSPERGHQRARAAALLMLGLPGGAYIYQGDELGLPEVTQIAPEERQDPLFATTGGQVIGRDGCRVPLPWSGQAPPFGFSPTGTPAVPWLPQPPAWSTLSVEHQLHTPGSDLAFHQAALRLRRTHPGLIDQSFAWVEGPEHGLLHFTRGGGLRVLANLSDAPAALPASARVLAASTTIVDGRLPPDAACWFEAS